jgi:hypothetical protein
VRREHLALVSAALTALCVVPYVRDIRRGTTRPQRTSWFVFATLSAVAAVAQLADGGGPGAYLATGAATGFTAVFVASLRTGVGGSSRRDRVVLCIAAVGVAASLLTAAPVVAVVGVISAELVAVGLTVRKGLDDPASETASTWCLDGLAGVVAVAAATGVHEIAYPVHHTLSNAAVLLAIIVGRRRLAARPAPAPATV